MDEVVRGEKSLKIIFWNPKEVIAEAATTIADADGKPVSIGEFLRNLPREKRVAVKRIPDFALTESRKLPTYSREGMQKMADAIGLSVEVYTFERGLHTEPELKLRVKPR